MGDIPHLLEHVPIAHDVDIGNQSEITDVLHDVPSVVVLFARNLIP